MKKVKAGRIAFRVEDRSSTLSFCLKGPGVNRPLTGVRFTGTKTVTLTLRKAPTRSTTRRRSARCAAPSASSDHAARRRAGARRRAYTYYDALEPQAMRGTFRAG